MTERPSSPRRVVFGDDGSSGADLAWLWINSQPWPGWDLVVLSADPPGIGQPVPDDEATPHPIPGEPRRVAFTEPGFVSVDFLEARIDPRLMLCGDHGAAVIVLGPASQGLGPWHLGSTTEWLLLGPPAPILVARSGRAVRRVLIAADGSVHSEAAIDTFLGLPLAERATVSVLAVDDGTGAPDAGDATVDRLREAGIEATPVHRQGRPHREILAEAGSATDLLVLGTRGVGGLDRLRLGGTASAVVRQAPCSVLVAQGDAPLGS